MTFRSALAKLDARSEGRIELGLDRVREHLSRLGDPQEKVPCFHVAGTNGKGATCAILAAVLRTAGYRTGLYVSPHLLNVKERISVDGAPISSARFARLLERAFAADPGSKLTYFELLTSVAFLHFAERRCDVVVLETGLGGRLDATNVVTSPLAALVTSIDFDHQEYLGGTLARIAAEKAGIFKRGRPALTAATAPAALRVLRRAAPNLETVARPWKTVAVDWDGGAQDLRSHAGRRYKLRLLGERQGRNAALAHAAVAASGLVVDERAWKKGLAKVDWRGRFEVVRLGKRRLIIDGAHNPEAARALAATWKATPWARVGARWILGLLRDKDATGVFAPLAPHLRDVVLVRPPSPRAADPLELSHSVRRAAPAARVTLERSVAAAISAWRRDATAPDVAVCAGSLYLAGAALRAVRRNP
jgi:dihydrofolate synthase/folylpolyglutamate synthase